jgi:NitT/TauT family transport system permease protein
MRLAMANSFTTVVSAEMIAASEGLGFQIWNARTYLDTDLIFVSIVVLGVLGFTIDRSFRFMIGRFASHYGPIA